MCYEDSNFHNGCRIIDLNPLFKNQMMILRPREQRWPKLHCYRQSQNHAPVLSIEAFSSYSNGFSGLRGGERPGSNVRWIQHAQRLNSKTCKRWIDLGGPGRAWIPTHPHPQVRRTSEAQVGICCAMGRQGSHTKKTTEIKHSRIWAWKIQENFLLLSSPAFNYHVT